MTFSSLVLADVRDSGCSTDPQAVSRFFLSHTVGARLTVRVIRVSFMGRMGLGANVGSGQRLGLVAAAVREDPSAAVQVARLPVRRDCHRGPVGRKSKIDLRESLHPTTDNKPAPKFTIPYP